jgi:hypothetical protein
MSCWRMEARIAGGHEGWGFLYGTPEDWSRIKEVKGENRMKDLTDVELTELADWAELKGNAEVHPDGKRAYGAIRQGVDWLIRFRIKQKQAELEKAGNPTTKTGKTQ